MLKMNKDKLQYMRWGML